MRISQLHSEFCSFQRTFKNNTPRTIFWLQEICKYFCQQSDIEYIHEVNLHVVKYWFMQGQSTKQWSAKTIRNRMSALSLFFDWCVTEKHLAENPMKQLPKPRLEKKIPRHLTIAQASYIFEWLKCRRFRYAYEKHRSLAIFAMFIYTGMRLSELLNLKVSEVNFEDNVIFIRSGKGNKDRIVPLIGRLEIYLKRYLKDREQIQKESIYFFVSTRKIGAMSYLVVRRLFEKITKEGKVHCHPHLLRHSYAVQMLEGGCDIFTLSKLLGHSDIKTTTIYLTATNAQKQRQAEKHPLY